MDIGKSIADYESYMAALRGAGVLRRKDAIGIDHAMADLLTHDAGTFAHSIEVAGVAARLAPIIGVESYIGLEGGLLHDVGKLDIDPNLLRASTLSGNGYVSIKFHPEAGCDLLRSMGRFSSSYISLDHHRHQPRSYPEHVADYPKSMPFSEIQKTDKASQLVALADCLSAFRRRNDHLKTQIRSSDDLHSALMADRPTLANYISYAFPVMKAVYFREHPL
jgi:putative nucleotidyltransferase with HDIG domain